MTLRAEIDDLAKVRITTPERWADLQKGYLGSLEMVSSPRHQH